MIKSSWYVKLFFLTILVVTSIACTKGSSDGDDGGSDAPPPSDGAGQATLDCGAVVGNSLKNPVSDSDGQAVVLTRVADSNAFIATDSTGGSILIKLHGISSEPSALRNNAIDYLGRFVGSTVLFIRASESCSAVLPGGGQAQVGQLVTSGRVSIAEQLVRTGFAQASSGDGCGSELVSGCFAALAESDPDTAGELDSFLWKPVADSDGRLAVHTGPFGTTVIVNDEVGINKGPGNGYGSLARFNKSGCGYASPRITVRSSDGLAYTVGGKTTFTVPAPCGRHCLEGGAIVACSK